MLADSIDFGLSRLFVSICWARKISVVDFFVSFRESISTVLFLFSTIILTGIGKRSRKRIIMVIAISKGLILKPEKNSVHYHLLLPRKEGGRERTRLCC